MTNFLFGLALGLLIWVIKEIIVSIKSKDVKNSKGGPGSGTRIK